MKISSDLFPLKPSFLPDEPITLRLDNQGNADLITIELYDLATKIETISMDIVPGAVTDLELLGISSEFLGIGVYGILFADNKPVETLNTSVDVSAKPYRQIRYGFLSDFTNNDVDEKDISQMLKMHINTVQFYDWSFRHNCLVSPYDSYTDMMGKHNVKTVINKKIQLCHKYCMQAIAYAPIYAADKDYSDSHPEQRLYNGMKLPITFIDIFYIMNPSHPDWQSHLFKQYVSAIEEMDFDGIHMDTYGFPKAAWDVNGSIVHLEESFNLLINKTTELLKEVKEDAGAIFNNVGGWPLSLTKNADQKAVYIEVWPPNDRYSNLAGLIAAAKQEKTHPVVLAAYPAPFRTCQSEPALESELLNSFIIAMHGATQLFFGEDACAVTQGYYADYTPLTEFQIKEIRRYQDFFVQYQVLFYDETLVDVSLTHQGWDNIEYVCHHVSSATGQPNMLWVHLAENRQRKIIYLVNLEQNDDIWNQGKQKPEVIKDLSFSIQVTCRHPRVFFASPDNESPMPSALCCHLEDTDRGIVLNTTVPTVFRCGVLWIEEENDG